MEDSNALREAIGKHYNLSNSGAKMRPERGATFESCVPFKSGGHGIKVTRSKGLRFGEIAAHTLSPVV